MLSGEKWKIWLSIPCLWKRWWRPSKTTRTLAGKGFRSNPQGGFFFTSWIQWPKEFALNSRLCTRIDMRRKSGNFWVRCFTPRYHSQSTFWFFKRPFDSSIGCHQHPQEETNQNRASKGHNWNEFLARTTRNWPVSLLSWWKMCGKGNHSGVRTSI